MKDVHVHTYTHPQLYATT